MLAANTIGISVPANVQTAAFQPVVVMVVTKVSTTTRPIIPETTSFCADIILFIHCLLMLVQHTKKRKQPKLPPRFFYLLDCISINHKTDLNGLLICIYYHTFLYLSSTFIQILTYPFYIMYFQLQVMLLYSLIL